MGTLTDINGTARNAPQRHSTNPTASQTLSGVPSSERLGKKPHFMSPTLASTKQSATKPDTIRDPAHESKHSGSGKWMASAVKRVGFSSRVGDGTPRSKKEGLSQQAKAVTFPDKLAAPSHSGASDSPTSSSTSSKVDKAALDKPLPSPPVVQMAATESFSELNRSLIDASERPLRRSPPGRPGEQEEWPVLFPEQPSLVQPQAKERYPLLPSGSYGALPDVEPKAVQKPASPTIQRKHVPSPGPRLDIGAKKKPQGKRNTSSSKDVSRPSTGSTTKSTSGSPSKLDRLSAGAAAMEKSNNEPKATIEPRQTRTSSLRARLSAGQVIKESPSGTSKVLGFTDFTVPQEPKRIAPAVPLVDDDDPFHSKPLIKRKEVDVVPRKSSIPVIRQVVPPVVTVDVKLTQVHNKATETPFSQTNTAPHDFGIYEDKDDNHQPLALGAIEESPQPKYNTKRLSVNSPEHGPTLKISPSADRLIMGTGSDKENEPESKKKRYGFVKADSRSSSKIRAPSRAPTKPAAQPRPSSSQGLPLSASRPKLVDAETREKKVKSADIGASLGMDHLLRLSGKQTSSSSRKSTDASGSDDPFFDAKSSLSKRMSRVTGTEKEPLLQNELSAHDVGSWVEPVQKHLSQTADVDASLLPADVQSILTHDEVEVPEQQKPGLDVRQGAVEPIDGLPVAERTPATVTKPTPSTPDQANVGSKKSGSLPPRSSSRTAHPNFTATKLSPISPIGNKEHVPQGFTDRQNRLGSLGGHGTSQLDLAAPSNRTSVAQESNKSHGSVSKGVLHKFGGLFHKRHSDNSSASVKTSKKNKPTVSINTNGSPFPPISEVHPIHRPTLSSMRRANGNPPRSPLPDLTTNGASTPALNSPLPTEISTTTTMAMQILESARKERSSPKKERLLELGKIMVDALTQARDAEKAMEEAKQAARKAEVAHALCKKSVGDISKLVIEWKQEMARDAGY